MTKQLKLIPLWFEGRWETEQCININTNNANTNGITVIGQISLNNLIILQMNEINEG